MAGWFMTEDVEEFLAAAGDFLAARAVECTVLVTVAETLRARGGAPFGEAKPLFGSWQSGDDGPVEGALLHTQPRPAMLTRMPPQAVTSLADAFATAGRPLPGVDANQELADAFAAAWHDRTGARSVVGLRQRLYRLGTLAAPMPAPRGRARLATAADRALLTAWLAAFDEEIDTVRADTGAQVDDRISYGGLRLWEVDGTPVAMACLTRRVAGTTRVTCVYTPPRHRRRGFGGAVTASVSQAALDAGVTDVLLFTDLANPTSNTLYQRLGYTPVEDHVALSFV